MTANWFDHLALVSAGLLIATLAAIPARALLRRDPSACYRLCLALLFGSVALLPMQWIVQGIGHEVIAPARARIAEWLERARSPREPAPPTEDTSEDAIRDPAARPVDEPFADRIGEAVLVQRAIAEEPAVEPDAEAAPASQLAPAAAVLAPASWSWRSAMRIAAEELRGKSGLGLWALGIALVGGRRLLGLARTARLLRRARPVDDPRLLALWREVAASSRIAGRVRLLASSELTAPACVGWLRPTLLLPASSPASTDPEALGWALRHELVHLERGDALIATLQSFLTALLWFHPAAWWLSAEIGRLRELSCDQVVVRGSGRRRSYALALLGYAAARHDETTDHAGAIDAGPHSAGVRCALLHWSRSPSQIQRRIEMLMVHSGPGSWSRRAAGRLLALGAFVVPAAAQVGAAATILPKDGVEVRVVAAAPAAPASLAVDPACVQAAVAVSDDGKATKQDAAKIRLAKKLKQADLEKLHEALARLHGASDALEPAHAELAEHLRAVAGKVKCAAAAPAQECCEDLADAESELSALSELSELSALAELSQLDALAELDELSELAELGYLDGEEFEFDLADLELELAHLDDIDFEFGDFEFGDFDFDEFGTVDLAMNGEDLEKVGRKVAEAMKKAGVDAGTAKEAAAKAMAEAKEQIAAAQERVAHAHKKKAFDQAHQEKTMRKRSAQGRAALHDDLAKREMELAEHAKHAEHAKRAAPHADPTIRQRGMKRSSGGAAEDEHLQARIAALEAELEALRAELDARKMAEHARQKASKTKRFRSL